MIVTTPALSPHEMTEYLETADFSHVKVSMDIVTHIDTHTSIHIHSHTEPTVIATTPAMSPHEMTEYLKTADFSHVKVSIDTVTYTCTHTSIHLYTHSHTEPTVIATTPAMSPHEMTEYFKTADFSHVKVSIDTVTYTCTHTSIHLYTHSHTEPTVIETTPAMSPHEMTEYFKTAYFSHVKVSIDTVTYTCTHTSIHLYTHSHTEPTVIETTPAMSPHEMTEYFKTADFSHVKVSIDTVTYTCTHTSIRLYTHSHTEPTVIETTPAMSPHEMTEYFKTADFSHVKVSIDTVTYTCTHTSIHLYTHSHTEPTVIATTPAMSPHEMTEYFKTADFSHVKVSIDTVTYTCTHTSIHLYTHSHTEPTVIETTPAMSPHEMTEYLRTLTSHMLRYL